MPIDLPLIWLQDIDHHHTSLGELVISQASLYSQKLPVPPGFCLSHQLLNELFHHNNLDSFFRDQLSSVDPLNVLDIQTRSRLITNKIHRLEFPDHLAHQIVKAYNQLSSDTILLRLSTYSKTLPQSVLSNQLTNPVFTAGDANFFEHLKSILKVVWQTESIIYRAKHSQPQLPSINILVQSVDHPSVSGQLLTTDPATNDTHTSVIEAIWGLPMELISGSLTPDQYRLNNSDFSVIHQQVSPQTTQTVFKKNHLQRISVPKKLESAPKLQSALIKKLVDLGKQIHRYHFFPQKIDFWIVKDKPFITHTQNLEFATPAPKLSTTTTNLTSITAGTPVTPGLVSGPCVHFKPGSQPTIKPGSIIITPNLTPELIPHLSKAIGVIAETGGQTTQGAIIARQLNLPCIVAATDISTQTKTGQVITLDSTHGIVYQGGFSPPQPSSPQTSSPAPTPSSLPTHTATKLYQLISTDSDLAQVGKRPIDGVVFYGLPALIKSSGHHPHFLLGNNRQQLKSDLTNLISSLGHSLGHRPLFYMLNPLTTSQLKATSHSSDFEPNDPNPLLGYFGAYRLIHDKSLTQLELASLHSARDSSPLNLNLIIPHLRFPAELQSLKKTITSAGFTRSSSFKLWANLNTPAALDNLSEFATLGIDGVFVDLDLLSSFLLGVDPDNSELESVFTTNHKTIKNLLHNTLNLAHRENLLTNILLSSANLHLVSDLVSIGANSFTILNSENFDTFRDQIYQSEHHHVKTH